MTSPKNTDYLQRLSRFFMLVMVVSTAQALDPLDEEQEIETIGASASFFVPADQEQGIQSLTDFVEAGPERTLKGFVAAADDVQTMLEIKGTTLVLTSLERAQVQTILRLGLPFITQHPDEDAFAKLLDIAFLMRIAEGPEAYHGLLLSQETPDTSKIMKEVRKVFYTASGKDRKKLNATDVDWVLALGKRGDIKAGGFSQYVWRAQNWKYPPQRIEPPVVVATEETHPKRRWGNRGYRNSKRSFNNGRTGGQRSRSNSW